MRFLGVTKDVPDIVVACFRNHVQNTAPGRESQHSDPEAQWYFSPADNDKTPSVFLQLETHGQVLIARSLTP